MLVRVVAAGSAAQGAAVQANPLEIRTGEATREAVLFVSPSKRMSLNLPPQGSLEVRERRATMVESVLFQDVVIKQ